MLSALWQDRAPRQGLPFGGAAAGEVRDRVQGAQGARQHRAAVNTGLQPGYSVTATRLGNMTTSDKKMLLNRKR